MKALAATVALATVLAATSTALAQPGAWGPPGASSPAPAVVVRAREPNREGMVIGFSAGGALGDGQTGSMGSFYIGGFINPNLALMFDYESFSADAVEADCIAVVGADCGDPVAENIDVSGVAVQLYLSERWWLKGNLGVAAAHVDPFGDLYGLGWAALTGIDVYNGEMFAFDVRASSMGGIFDEGSSARAGLGVGFSWR